MHEINKMRKRGNKLIEYKIRTGKNKCTEFIHKYLNIEKIGESQLEQLAERFSISIMEAREAKELAKTIKPIKKYCKK